MPDTAIKTVKVTKCPNRDYWYSDLIGKTFDVIETLNGQLKVVDEHPTTEYYIRPEDADTVRHA